MEPGGEGQVWSRAVRIDQFLPSFVPDDAIGNHVRNVRRALRQAGYDSDIWAEDIHRSLRDEARPYRVYESSGAPADVVVYHVAHHSPLAGFLEWRSEPLVVDYHNITPAEFFAGWDPRIAESMDQARRELRQLAPRTVLGLADSIYNREELVAVGYAHTAVSPVVVDYDQWSSISAERTSGRDAGADQGARWLFVGRIAPNKCQHDLVGALAVHRALFDPSATLALVGATTSRLYLRSLQRLVQDLDLDGAVDITGPVPTEELRRHLLQSDVLVCLSEHEGFCVPIVEAMAAGLPVVAFASAAVPETLGGAGFLVDDKDPLMVACTLQRLRDDARLRAELVGRGHRRVAELSRERTAACFVDHLRGVVARLGIG